MGDRTKLSQVGQGLIIAALLTLAGAARSSIQAQAQSTPPPLTQLIHSFEIQQPEATAYAIWNTGSSGQQHEVWFRLLTGEADYQQRLRVYKEQAAPRSPEMLPPSSTMVYEVNNNNASDWIFLGTENSFFTYYFEGDSRLNETLDWDQAEAVSVQKAIYNNGESYIISFEDIRELDDYDDLEVEVLLIRR